MSFLCIPLSYPIELFVSFSALSVPVPLGCLSHFWVSLSLSQQAVCLIFSFSPLSHQTHFSLSPCPIRLIVSFLVFLSPVPARRLSHFLVSLSLSHQAVFVSFCSLSPVPSGCLSHFALSLSHQVVFVSFLVFPSPIPSGCFCLIFGFSLYPLRFFVSFFGYLCPCPIRLCLSHFCYLSLSHQVVFASFCSLPIPPGSFYLISPLSIPAPQHHPSHGATAGGDGAAAAPALLPMGTTPACPASLQPAVPCSLLLLPWAPAGARAHLHPRASPPGAGGCPESHRRPAHREAAPGR